MSFSNGARAGLLAGVCLAGFAPLSAAYAAAPTAQATADAPVATAAAPMQLAAADAAADRNASPVAQLSEVVVTADRRTTSLQKTPLAISAVSSAALDASFINEISGLNGLVPSLEITKQSGFENIVTIRGVGSETPENAPTTTPGVSLFVDGVYIANTISLDQTLFDLDRIEVLRGPQGALYGQSSIGGAINIVTKQPELGRFSGMGDFSAGDYNLTRARAEVNIPIGDTVAIRGSIQKYDHEGFTKDVYFSDFRQDDADDLSGKAAILWKPTSNFSATLTGQWYHSNTNGAAQKNILDPETDVRELYQDYPSKFHLTTQLYHLNLQYDTPWFSVRSVTAYQELNHVQQEDSSRSAFSILGAYDDVAAWNTKLKNYNEEFDILSLPGARLEWIAGAFVLNQTSRQFVVEYETPQGDHTDPNTDPSILAVPADIETPPYPSNLAYGNDDQVNRQSYSAFGQATLHVTSKLRVTAGARINHDAYEGHSFNFSAFSAVDNPPVSQHYGDTKPTWRVEADYDLTPNNLIYASNSRGYKPGGINGKNGQAVILPTYTSETNTAFEVGSKSLYMDHALRVNLAAFYYVYKNMQYIEYDPIPFDSGISNIPSVHSYGFEAESNYVSPDHHFHLNGSIALENARVDGNYSSIDSTVANAIENQPYPSPCAYGGQYYNPACFAAVEASARDLKGKSPPAMPKISGSVNASYQFDTQFGPLTPRVEYIYRGSEWARIFNEPTLDRVSAYGVTNFNLDFVPLNTRFRFSLTATNAFNVDGVNSRYTDPYGTGQTSQQYIPPRQIIGTAAYAF